MINGYHDRISCRKLFLRQTEQDEADFTTNHPYRYYYVAFWLRHYTKD